MWIPKCCNSQNVDSKFRHTVKIYYRQLLTKTESSVQKNSYNSTQILMKRCFIKDSSTAAQDTAINSNVKDLANTKELIFKYFNVTNYSFNEIEWSGGRYQVLGIAPKAEVSLDSKKYIASDSQPFISIIIGLKKL